MANVDLSVKQSAMSFFEKLIIVSCPESLARDQEKVTRAPPCTNRGSVC